MRTTLFDSVTALALASTALSQSPQHLVAPAAYDQVDALAYEWLAGACAPRRQQILVGPSHLQPMLANATTATITAIEFRRNAAAEVYQGGSMQLTVTLSTAPHGPLDCDDRWPHNIGPDATTVFAGVAMLPTSPATAAGMGTPVPWTPANTLRLQFAQPFVYRGGTICVQLLGTPIPGQEAQWWMADAVAEVIATHPPIEFGRGCGTFGGPNRQWSFCAERTLIPSKRADFFADGPDNGLAVAVIGDAAPWPIPLSMFGFATPGCSCYVNPSAVICTLPAVFEPQLQVPAIQYHFPGRADVLIHLPPNPLCFGIRLTTQWFDLTQQATSPAHTWTVASAIPTIDMALNECHPLSTCGTVTTDLAPVVRFEWQ